MAYREEFDLGKTASKPTAGPTWNPATQRFEAPGGESWGAYKAGLEEEEVAGRDGVRSWTVPQKQTGTTTTTEWMPSGVRPDPYTVTPFEAPEWDEAEISRLTQKRAAPGLRRLRSAVQMAMTRPYESPQIRRMTLREALSGFGMGLESVMGGAGREATGEYGARYGREFTAATMTWQAQQTQRMADWQSLWNEYMRKGKQVATTEFEFGEEGEQEIPEPSWAFDPSTRRWAQA